MIDGIILLCFILFCFIVGWLESDSNKHSTAKSEVFRTLSQIDSMTARSFEKYCVSLLYANGYYDVKTTPTTGDQGVDILACKGKMRYAIQCKHYKSNVGNHAVQEVYAGKSFYKCDIAIVLTNSHFTPAAQKLANKTGVILWGREQLQELIYRAEKNLRRN